MQIRYFKDEGSFDREFWRGKNDIGLKETVYKHKNFFNNNNNKKKKNQSRARI
jgi:hypothetical protein